MPQVQKIAHLIRPCYASYETHGPLAVGRVVTIEFPKVRLWENGVLGLPVADHSLPLGTKLGLC